MDKRMRMFTRVAKEYGATFERTGSGHIKFRLPDGRWVTCAYSPTSDLHVNEKRLRRKLGKL